MNSQQSNYSILRNLLFALVAILMAVGGLYAVTFHDAKAIEAPLTISAQQATPLPPGVLGMLSAISGRGGGGGGDECDKIGQLSESSFWLVSDAVIYHDNHPYKFGTPYDEITAIRCGEPSTEPVTYTLSGPDGIMFQQTAELPYEELVPESNIIAATDYFSYPIMDWNMEPDYLTLSIEGDLRPVIFTFFVLPAQRIFVSDWQTDVSQENYAAGSQLRISASGFSADQSLNLVLYRFLAPQMIPVQTTEITTDRSGQYAGSYFLPDDLPSAKYVLVTCHAIRCSVKLDKETGFELSSMTAAFIDVVGDHVFVDSAAGFSGLRILDLDNSGARLGRAEPGEQVVLLDSTPRMFNGARYVEVRTQDGIEGWALTRYLITYPVEEAYFDLTWCSSSTSEVRRRFSDDDRCATYYEPLSLEEFAEELKSIRDGNQEINMLAEDEMLASGSVDGTTLQLPIVDAAGAQTGWINLGTNVPHDQSPSPIGAVWRTNLNNNPIEPICWHHTNLLWQCETAEGLTPWIQ
ncbi:MAG: hypothetical protein KDE46_19540 [Caldilineaceae bacterium]|nr:hypothetical protein [Caldilineaceae bacterium]